jgi:outer membrane protein TolC
MATQSPEIAAARLEQEAALARHDASGVWADPMLEVEAENMPKGMAVPDSLKTTIRQDIPFWGKRGLQRDIAGYQAEASRYRAEQAVWDVRENLREQYAIRYAAFEGTRLTEDLLKTLRQLSQLGKARYSQNLGEQDAMINPELSASQMEVDLVRMQNKASKAQARLNALLGRDVTDRLASPTIPILPPAQTLSLTILLDKAATHNPILAESSQEVSAMQSTRSLARRNVMPDVNLGYSQTGYEMGKPSQAVMVGVSLPLHWGAKQDEIRAATADARAQEERHRGLLSQVKSDLQAALLDYQSNAKLLDVQKNHHIPLLEVSLKSKLAAMEYGKTDMNGALEAIQELRKAKLEILDLQIEQQKMLGDLEKLTGETL